MEKINIAALLKDCPKGMELDCTMFNDVVFNTVEFGKTIIVTRTNGTNIHLDKYGTFFSDKDAKCVIFPKGKTTWEEFQRPFMDGDVITNGKFIAIFHKFEDGHMYYYCWYNNRDNASKFKIDFGIGFIDEYHLATEEEKEKLFQAIKDNGYEWDAETKTLKKLIQPKFKVGNRIKPNNSRFIYTITDLLEDRYRATVDSHGLHEIAFERQDAYELVHNKFDITTLKPFDKVLVRTKNFTPTWTIDFYDGYQPNIGGNFTPFGVTGGKYFQQCIPYEGNEHLRGTTKDCDEYFKTWN